MFDHVRFDPGVANHGQCDSGRATLGVMVDGEFGHGMFLRRQESSATNGSHSSGLSPQQSLARNVISARNMPMLVPGSAVDAASRDMTSPVLASSDRCVDNVLCVSPLSSKSSQVESLICSWQTSVQNASNRLGWESAARTATANTFQSIGNSRWRSCPQNLSAKSDGSDANVKSF